MNQSELYEKLLSLKQKIELIRTEKIKLESEYMFYLAKFDLNACEHDYSSTVPGKRRKYCLICNKIK